MDLNFTGPLICEFFSVVNATVLHSPQLVESLDRMANYKLCAVLTVWKIGTPNSCVVQGSAVVLILLSSCQLQYKGLKTSNFLIFVTLFIYCISEELFCAWRFFFFYLKCWQNVPRQKLLSSILKI